MKIKLLVLGKTSNSELKSLVSSYEKRLSYYIDFEMEVIPGIKNLKSLSKKEIKERESRLILDKIPSDANVILLDEKGKNLSSIDFSKQLEKRLGTGIRQLTFVIGGAYGFSEEMRKTFENQLSLSKMTFSHQMIRLLFVEQLYRAFTIIKGESYHHKD